MASSQEVETTEVEVTGVKTNDVSLLQSLSGPPTHIPLNGSAETCAREEIPRTFTPALSEGSVEPTVLWSPSSRTTPPPSSRTTPTPSNRSSAPQDARTTLDPSKSLPLPPPSEFTPTALSSSVAPLEAQETFKPSLVRGQTTISSTALARSDQNTTQDSRWTTKLSVVRSFSGIGVRSTWPNPQDSIGELCDLPKKLKFKCWEAKGPALELNDELRPALFECMNSNPDTVWRRSKTSPVLIRIYMLGKSEADARPYLVISGKKQPRENTATLIRESHILERFRDKGGLEVKELPKHPIRLASGELGNMGSIMISIEGGPISYDPVVEMRENFGVQIYVQCRDVNHSLYWNKATVGCILRHRGKYLAWTAAHPFLDIPLYAETSTSEDESDRDFNFEDEHSSLAINEEPPDVAPTGSGTSQISVKRPLSHPNFASDSRVSIESRSHPPKLDTFGSLFASSINQRNETGLDWALIEISESKFTTLQALKIINGKNLQAAFGTTPIQTEVFAATGSHGLRRGELSPMPAYMALPPNRTFGEVWSVRFDGPLEKGDCGALVIDSDGTIYGHIVAGELEQGIGYIIPAGETFADMRRKVDDRLSLSGSPLGNWQEIFDALMPQEMSSAPTMTTRPPPFRDPPAVPEHLSGIDDEGSRRANSLSSTMSVAVGVAETRARRRPIQRLPITLPARSSPHRIRTRGMRNTGLKKLNGWDKRIRYPKEAVSIDERRAFIIEHIDRRGFDWLVVMASGSGIFAASYALFAPSMILPSLNFVYWPSSTSMDKNVQIRAVSLTGAVLGSLISGFLADTLGRRRMYQLGPVLLLVGAVGCAEASAGFNNQTMAVLGWILFWQFVIGFGVGVEFTLSAVTTAEFAPTRARSRMMAAVIVMQPLASLVVSALVLVLLVSLGRKSGLRHEVDHSNAGIVVDKLWRFAIGLGAIPAIFALWSRITIPESPRWTLDVFEDENGAFQQTRRHGHYEDIMDMNDQGNIGLPDRRPEMSQTGDMGIARSLHRISAASVSDEAVGEMNPETDLSEIESQEISDRSGNEPNHRYEETRSHFHGFSYRKLRYFFSSEGNWRPLTAIALSSFCLNAAMSGLGGDNYRIIAQVWVSPPVASNMSSMPAFTDGQSHSNILGAEIYDIIWNMALHSIAILSSGSVVGALILVKLVNSFSRKQLLAILSLCLGGLFSGIFGSFLSKSDKLQGARVALYILCYGIFNLGPNLMLFMIPTEIFPTRYRATAFAITFSSGKIGAIIGQTISSSYSSGGRGWVWYLIGVVPLLFATAGFAWLWLRPTRGYDDEMLSDIPLEGVFYRGRHRSRQRIWGDLGRLWWKLRDLF